MVLEGKRTTGEIDLNLSDYKVLRATRKLSGIKSYSASRHIRISFFKG